MRNFTIFILLLCSFICPAQSDATQSIEGIVKEMLNIITIEKGEKPDFKAFRNLFLPSATFTVHSHNDSFPEPVETVSLDDFVELLNDPYYEQGFEEIELHKVINEYNGIAHVFQTYRGKDGEGESETGINSYQLVYDKDRWWIVNLLWTGDSNGVKVPDKYLGK